MVNNPFYKYSGSDILRNPVIRGLILLFAVFIAFALSKGGFLVAIILFVLPIATFALIILFRNPALGLSFAFVINFFIIGISRYITVKLGYLMDITLFMTYIAWFFVYFEQRMSLSILKNDLVYLALIWFIYLLLTIMNPEAYSKMAWFSAVRGIGLYMVLTIPLIFLLQNEPKYLDKFLMIWGVISILAALKAWMQMNIGPDPWEQKWLDSGGAITHIIFGKFRAFSFYSDAGQFGAALGHVGIVGMLIAINVPSRKMKIFWSIVAIAGYYGMSVSGTRGALFVPIGGGALYILLNRNFKAFFIGLFLFAVIYTFFRYTYIGNSNYQIYRMRSAFRPEDDASYMVRIENQKRFSEYLKSRPFGVGVGHAGARAKSYAQESFLSNIATDSWFVLIWAENGIIGLYLHMFILGYIIGKGSYIVMFRLHDKVFRAKIMALLCGIFGILTASYGNAVFGQFPTGILMYSSMAFIFLSPMMEEKLLAERKQEESQTQTLNT
ncbi:MAG TPA: hypothetical protein PKJ24_08855 [Prolixibacteraceae bacterium]|nr:hypothetical protein [Prolixibacteraceae bacterium]